MNLNSKMKKDNILVTGRPGIGKTTVLQRICKELEYLHPVGFFTREIRENGKRQGFELTSMDQRQMILAHTSKAGQGKVGKYGVDIHGFEAFLDAVDLESLEARFVVVDEIGKMECLSPKFVTMVRRVLESEKPFLATVAAKGGGFIHEVKSRYDVELISLTEQNRETLARDLVRQMQVLLD